MKRVRLWLFNLVAGMSLGCVLLTLVFWFRGASRIDRISYTCVTHDEVAPLRFDVFVFQSDGATISVWREFRKVFNTAQAAKMAALNTDLPRWNWEVTPHASSGLLRLRPIGFLRDVERPVRGENQTIGRSLIFAADWMLALVFSLPPGMWIILAKQRRVRQRRASNGLCVKCGYDLRASPDRCPECGMMVPPRPSPPAA
jgi:hypothetical protein